MKVITGNRLPDGAVIYLNDNDQWTVCLDEAAHFDDKESAMVLGTVQTRTTELADVYLIEIGDGGALAGRQALRETIRQSGPSVHSGPEHQQEALTNA